ncbi:hypothetical protein ACIOEX_01720 [Streptomyces sp. NPDC087850]|uniref:hypothetical protein n=1 Tax=Streptomyces sp. NPDC087850 TaxID=3365809 RepID=UPI00380EE07F
MSDSREPRPLAAAELLSLAIAADQVDNGLAPVGSSIGKCPACGTDVISGEGWEPPHTFDLYWTAKPCGCGFRVSEEALCVVRQALIEGDSRA